MDQLFYGEDKLCHCQLYYMQGIMFSEWLLIINLQPDWQLANPAAVLAYKHPGIHEGPCYC